MKGGGDLANTVLLVMPDNDGNPIINLCPDAFEHVAAWGVLLADIARHVARGRGQLGFDERAEFEAIANTARQELDDPTTQIVGNVLM